MKTTYYSNTKSAPIFDVEISEILRAIKGDNHKDLVNQYRNITDEAQKRQFKADKIPCFTVSGTFEGKTADTIKKHSGFIAMDFDGVEDLDQTRSLLYADQYTYAGFLSVSGKGICLLVKIDGSKHLESFKGLEKYYFEKYGEVIDTQTSNVNRLRFYSHDPNLFLNPNSKVFTDIVKKPKGRPINIPDVVFTGDDIDYIIQQIQARRIDITEDYQTWVNIGFAIYSHYGESGLNYFQQVSQFHPDYDPTKTEKKYKTLTNPQKISISTLFYHAKKAGIEITTAKTKHIARVATFGKKGKRTKDQVIKQLEELDQIPENEAKEVVEQVYNSNFTEVKTDKDDNIEVIETFIKRECQIRYNEITLKYEREEKPMNDRDFNSLYLNCKKVVPEVSKDLFLSCIDSDRTPIYNPIKEFFAKYKSRKPERLIETLAESIITNSKDQDYHHYFIRKWMIGCVAMWHKKHSPLMLILAGDKQNTGKSYFFRHLLPQEMQSYYAEAELTGDKDENLLMCSKMIIMNDEMSNKSKRDITVMKKLCSTEWFNLRKPYGRLSEDFRRIAGLCGTSNSLELISDPTGNRRIIPIEVLQINHAKYNSIDKIDLWMEAYHAYKAGEEHQLNSKDIEKLNRNTDKYEEASPEFELLTQYYKPALESDFPTYVTNTEIKSYLEKASQQRLSSKKLGMELKKIGFKKEGKTIEGIYKQVYAVALLQGFSQGSAPF
jgi:predicted P-loop ATPase